MGVNHVLIFLRIFFNTLFGLSTRYWMAIVTRGMLGMLCGILGPIKVAYCLCLPQLATESRHYILMDTYVFSRHMLQKSAGKSTKL